uniref:Interleukin 17C n=2 Tax=Callorhinchus milii TaxID=7868 RepID=A0A4W3GCH9_CALMI|eukprot:gi/632978796/ref/XP_007906115.1/ PREDICTED: interleukin-17C [Callorhinchus milii]
MCAGRREKRVREDRCWGPGQPTERALRLSGRTGAWVRFPSVYLVEKLETRGGHRRHHSAQDCPKLLQPGSSDPSHRSISPWTYRIDYDENRFPEKLAFAECLCKGCINTASGLEEHHLNSVLLEQTMMVLRRRPCPHDPHLYSFQMHYIRVPVGCTCVLPRKHTLPSA